MRIVSLVPHATELLFALGLGDQVVGVTHECDHPAEALERRHVTRDRLPPGLSAGEIDAAVRAFTEGGDSIYELDTGTLAELAPDLIVTQALCYVCAVSADDVRAVAKDLPSRPQVLSLDPHTFGETMGDARTVATATKSEAVAADFIARTARRVDDVERALEGVVRRPRVAAIEWMDPVFVGGHWTPQLIEMAGGIDVLGFPGEHSAQTTWEEVKAARPDVIIAMPCGYDAQRSHQEALTFADRLRDVGAGQVWAVDSAGLFSRPGPRLVDGLELLAHLLHPDRVTSAPSEALAVEL
jgi:iron complex transport system substrate-binding protein